MKKRSFNLVRVRRREHRLSSSDVAMLLHHNSGSSLARIERGERLPSLPVALALQLLFDTPLRELFPCLHESVEDAVMRRALALHVELEGRTGKRAVVTREFLEALPRRGSTNDIEL